jgi:hypothetical protein
LGTGVYLTCAEVPRGRATHKIKLRDPPWGRLESAFGCFPSSRVKEVKSAMFLRRLPGAQLLLLAQIRPIHESWGGGGESLVEVRKGLE